MSLLVFTGGSQFAAISVIGAGGAAATAVANALLLAVRNGAYGLSLASLLGGSLPRRALSDGERIVLDARVPALGVAALCVWRGAPFLVTVVAAALVAAGLRAIAG